MVTTTHSSADLLEPIPASHQPTLYISGSAADAQLLLPVLQPLVADGCRYELLGSSGGALLAAFLSLGSVDASEKRDFLTLCQKLHRPTVSWPCCLEAVRAWVRAVTGGAACSLRQWRARCGRGFSVLVYDAQSSMPVILGADERLGVADVLASACVRGSPSFDVPERPGLPWADIETVLPSTLICSALRPLPFLHLTSNAGRRRQESGTTPQLEAVCDCYETMFSVPPCVLTWRAHTAQEPASALALFDPSRWSQGLSCRRAPPAMQSSTPFALGLLVWTIVSCFLALGLCPVEARAVLSDSADGAAPSAHEGEEADLAPSAHEGEEADLAPSAHEGEEVDLGWAETPAAHAVEGEPRAVAREEEEGGR